MDYACPLSWAEVDARGGGVGVYSGCTAGEVCAAAGHADRRGQIGAWVYCCSVRACRSPSIRHSAWGGERSEDRLSPFAPPSEPLGAQCKSVPWECVRGHLVTCVCVRARVSVHSLSSGKRYAGSGLGPMGELPARAMRRGQSLPTPHTNQYQCGSTRRWVAFGVSVSIYVSMERLLNSSIIYIYRFTWCRL